jgi:hypothetical protein
MKPLLICALALLLCNSVLRGQFIAPEIDWQISVGGTQHDNAQELIQTADGGFLIVGYTESTDFDATGNHGNGDAWVVKLDSNGSYQWHRCYGGTRHDRFNSVAQLQNGNYILCGQTASSNGDVVGLHGTSGTSDIWVVIINNAGEILWQRCLGGTKQDRGSYAFETSDGALVVFGNSYSKDGDVIGTQKGKGDIWLVKMDVGGNILWQQLWGGEGSDFGYMIRETADKGFIAISYTTSMTGDISGNHGEGDGLVQKLDSAGNVQWQRCIGGSLDDYLHAVEQMPNGEYVMIGRSLSYDGDISGHHDSGRSKDYTFFKLDANGNTAWQRCYGGTKDECGYDFTPTFDGGYALIGHTYSNDADVSGNHEIGEADYWLVKVDGNANIEWQKCLGGTGVFGDNPYVIIQTPDGGYVMAGRSDSQNGDVTGNHGKEDLWVVKLQGSAVPDHTILTGTISPLSFEAGDSLMVPFSITGVFEEGNTFTAELSDANGSFALPQVIGSVNSSTSQEIPSVIPVHTPGGSAYRIRVLSSSPQVTGATSSSVITITVSPEACTIPEELTASDLTSSSGLIAWNAVPVATSYKIRYKVSGTSVWTNLTATGTSLQLIDLLPNSSYVWQVKAICQSSPLISSDWSPQSGFSTTPLRLGASGNLRFECYPNPASSAVQIRWEQELPDYITIELLNVLNQKVAGIGQGTFESGIHWLEFDVSSYSSGTYWIRIIAGEEVMVKRLLVE